MEITCSRRIELALVLGALSAFPALSLDLYLPGMPAMSRELQASAGTVQLSVTVFVIGLALGQVVVGPLSDTWGRRPLLVGGLAVYVAGSLACLVAPSVGWLVAARAVQSLGAAAATVLARAVARDHFEGTAMTRFVSSLMLVNGLATVLGPVVGGQLLRVASWRTTFLVLAVTGVLLLAAVALLLPESLPAARRSPTSLAATARSFRRLARDRRYAGYVLTAALLFSAMFAYISASSFVLQEAYGLSAQQYGAVFAVNAVGLLALGQLNAALVGRVASEEALLGASLVLACVAGAGTLASVLTSATLPWLLASLFVLVSSLGPVLANTTSLALAPYADQAGTAASLQGVAQYLVSGLVGAALSLVTHDARSATLAMGIAVAASAAAALVVHRMTHHPSPQDVRTSPAAGAGRDVDVAAVARPLSA